MKALKSTIINFGIVSFPVQICNGTNARADVKFKQVGPNGESLKQQYVDDAGTVIPREAFRKGYEVSKDKMVTLDPAAVEAIAEATKIGKDGLDVQFVDRSAVTERMDRIKGRFFIQPASTTPLKTFRLFTEALAESDRAFVAKWCPRTRQELLVGWVNDEGVLVAGSMEFAIECNSADEAVKAHLAEDVAEPSEAEKNMAVQLMDAMTTGGFEALDTPIDEAIPMRLDLVQKAIAGEKIEAPAAPAPATEAVVDLADALAASLAAVQAKKVAA